MLDIRIELGSQTCSYEEKHVFNWTRVWGFLIKQWTMTDITMLPSDYDYIIWALL